MTTETTATHLTPTHDVPCVECGGPTMPPYTADDGAHHPGYYCEGCGATTFPAYDKVDGLRRHTETGQWMLLDAYSREVAPRLPEHLSVGEALAELQARKA